MTPLKSLAIYGTKIGESQDEILGNVIVTTYKLEPNTRDGSKKITLSLSNKVVELVLEDGSTWMCDESTLYEIYPELDPAIPSNDTRDQKNGEYILPNTISQPGDERGIIGKIVVKFLRVFIKDKLEDGIESLAKKMEDRLLLHGVPVKEAPWNKLKESILEDGGALFNVDGDFRYTPFKVGNNAEPYLLFIHGTNSDTLGAFQNLKSSSTWKTLQQIYEENVIAFQHRTLTMSPLENALTLAKLLPSNIELHIISHSRGGIVGDILSKYNGQNSAKGFTNEQIAFLEGEGREQDLEVISSLNTLFTKKKIQVTKFIRVACPASGTTLVSKRLDTYLNVILNLVGKGVILGTIKELLRYCISHKDNTDVLPGVEAQNPDSPFQKVLNHPSEQGKIHGQSLIVISGNSQFSASKRGLLTILGKLFYWKRNDLVVDTNSMYLGGLRNNNIQYFFDEGAHVDHFNFFGNPSTSRAIELALTTPVDSKIPGFKSTDQVSVPEEDRALLEGGELKNEGPPSGERPVVVLLPGIMGSNLYQQKKELWLNYGRILTGGLLDLKYASINKISADSVVKTSYNKLYGHLSKNYDVVLHPFDWRKPLTESAQDFEGKIKALLLLNQPIKIIGHSMGGVLVRDFIINHRQTWRQLNSSPGFRLIFLGSPLKGSHRILTVLFGKDAIIRKLAGLDIFHSKKRLVEVFKEFPGILGLLPLKNNLDDFSDIRTWREMRQVFGKKSWPLPSAQVLKEFGEYQDNVLEKTQKIDYSNMSYIAGLDKMTPCGYYLDKKPPKKLYFLYTGKGDQSVTWELGIPEKLIQNNTAYYSRVSHGALANDPSLFGGIDEILEKGRTSLLRTSMPLSRAKEQIFRAEPTYDFDLSERGLENTLFGADQGEKYVKAKLPLTVTISKGHLKYSSYPILAGHFFGDGILYAERAIDNCLEGQLSDWHGLGLYPGEIETFQHFSPKGKSDFAGAIILGIGEQGKLTPYLLAKSVEKGILNYLLEIGKNVGENKTVGISSLLIASSYGGLSMEGSLKGIIEGINNANERIQQIVSPNHPTIQFLELIELYSDRALNSMYTIIQMIRRDDRNLNINLGSSTIKTLLGHRNRIPLNDTADWWNRITIKYKRGKEDAKIPDSFIFSVATGDSREEESELYNGTVLIDTFISEISLKNQWNDCDAKTLFELLIPNPFKEKLKQKGNISLIVDLDTASYPWELLQDNSIGAKPLCINAGMIRQLSTPIFRTKIKRANNNYAFVVADPKTEGFLTQLPGALREGNEISEILNKNGYEPKSLIGSNATDIIRNLFCHDYTIIHLAGHGIFNPESPRESGMVIGKEQFLTVFQIEQLPIVPDLVFVNCCHLGFADSKDERFYQDRYKLAANIGTELIKIGVKAVIASGWAVNDAAALEFARCFYEEMFDGNTFGNAVKEARNKVYDEFKGNTNTWGAYQCYGDPFFTLKDYSKKMYNPSYIVPEEVEVDLENLFNNMQIGSGNPEDFKKQLEIIVQAAEKGVSFNARIYEKIAEIYQELGNYEQANKGYTILLKRENADFAMKTMEKYCNISIKLLANQHLHKQLDGEEPDDTPSKIIDIIKDLEVLRSVGETAKRLNLLGSAYKRLSLVANNNEDRAEALKMSQAYYERAFAHEGGDRRLYSLINVLEIASILSYLEGKAPVKFLRINLKSENKKITNYKRALELLDKQIEAESQKPKYNEMNYWDMVSSSDVELAKLILDPKGKENRWLELSEEYTRLWKKAGSEAKKMVKLEQLQFLILSAHHAQRNLQNDYLDVLDKSSQVPDDLNVNLMLLKDILNNI